MISLKKFCYVVISGWCLASILEVWRLIPEMRYEVVVTAAILSLAGVALLWVKEKK